MDACGGAGVAVVNSETGAAAGGADAAPTISTSFWGLV